MRKGRTVFVVERDVLVGVPGFIVRQYRVTSGPDAAGFCTLSGQKPGCARDSLAVHKDGLSSSPAKAVEKMRLHVEQEFIAAMNALRLLGRNQ